MSSKKIGSVENPFSTFRYFDILLGIGAITGVIFLACWQGKYTADPHHWGLMLSNASDINQGRIPYKEVFIQYGYLTSLVHAVALKIGGNLQSLIGVTSLFYGLGIVATVILAWRITKSRIKAGLALCFCMALHPITIYPWANYVAFPFLAYGVLTLLDGMQNNKRIILGGLSMGLAVLAREGLFFPLTLGIFSLAAIDIYIKNRPSLSKYTLLVASYLLVLIIFLSWLWVNDIYYYWYVNSVLLPKYYAQVLYPTVGSFNIFEPLYTAVLFGIKNFDPRWMAVSLTLGASAMALVYSLANFKYLKENLLVIKLSLLTWLFTSTMLHLAEIFRFATASVIGIVLVLTIRSFQKLILWFLSLLILWMFINVGQKDSGNYYYPSFNKRELGSYDGFNIPIFKNQKWGADIINYYEEFQRDLNKINYLNCKIAYHYNDTSDAFLHVLSPFQQSQWFPFADGPFGRATPENLKRLNELRPDLNYEEKIEQAKGIVLFVSGDQDETNKRARIPSKYIIYSSYKIPKLLFVRPNQNLMILVPTNCFD
jgi:hypothetical protein